MVGFIEISETHWISIFVPSHHLLLEIKILKKNNTACRGLSGVYLNTFSICCFITLFVIKLSTEVFVKVGVYFFSYLRHKDWELGYDSHGHKVHICNLRSTLLFLFLQFIIEIPSDKDIYYFPGKVCFRLRYIVLTFVEVFRII